MTGAWRARRPAGGRSPSSATPTRARPPSPRSSSSTPGRWPKQLDEEGVIQLLHDPDIGEAAPLLGAVGQMQFEVFAHRLAHEFGATVTLDPAGYTIARRTDPTSAERLRTLGGVAVYARPDGTLYALFESPYWLQRVEADHPDLALDPILTE